MGVFISCLAEYTTGIKKKKSERQKKKKGNERQTRWDSAHVKTEVFE